MCSVALVSVAGGVHAQTLRICQIQGTTVTPSSLGARVTTTGIVTADFMATSLGGFFIQDPSCDSDPATSDGIWVQGAKQSPGPAVGNRVTVSGRVADDFGLTSLVLESLNDGGPYAGGVEAVRLNPPSDPTSAAAYLEAHEGMLVSLPLSRVIAATNHFGEAYLMPDASAVTRLYRNDQDGRKLGLASPAGWLSLNHGDRVSDASGPLTYTFGEFKVLVRPERAPSVDRASLTPAQVAPAPLTVATYNLENLFDPVDDPGKDDAAVTPSPTQYPVDLERRATSIGRYLGAPDILGVQEVEKIEVLQDLLAQPELVPFAYRAVLVEGADGRGIDVGLLYRSDRVSLRSAEARPVCSDLPATETQGAPCMLPGGTQGALLFARPPLVVKLETIAPAPERLTVVVNHFKAQDGQDSTDERVRQAMAAHVLAIADELRANEPDTSLIVMGDLNDFEDSPTLLTLTGGGRLVNPMSLGAAERPYTYIFQGLSQTLDHILVDTALAPRVLECAPVHINVDFGDAGPDAPLAASPRTSDHDPVRLTLRPR